MSTDDRPPTSGGDAPAGGPREEPETGEDFARMLEESLRAGPPQNRAFEPGQSVEGVIVAFGRDAAFVDIGGKGEATMSLEELRNEAGEIAAEIGDRVKALIVSTGPTLQISRRLAMGSAAREQIEAAYRSGVPVEGRVAGLNKGGYEIRVSGLRGFCPLSQIGTDRSVEPGEHVGRTYTFRILELREGGRNMVLSRRAILEEEERERAAEILRSAVPGAVLSGRVASVTSYGAFVDLGAGVQGLLHVSEMAWARVASPAEVVQPGQPLTVQVVKVEDQGRKISLSLKQLQADPWLKVGEAYRVGQILRGRVTRLADFGAFVELEPGIEALAHVSTFPPGSADWKAAVPAGAERAFRIESIDPAKRRIGVALHEGASGEKDREAASGDEQARAGEGFGSIADKLRDAMKRGGEGS